VRIDVKVSDHFGDEVVALGAMLPPGGVFGHGPNARQHLLPESIRLGQGALLRLSMLRSNRRMALTCL